MRKLALFALLAATCQAGFAEEPPVAPVTPPPAPTAETAPKPASSDVYVTFPDLKVQLIKPEGFDEAARFDGFEQPATRSFLTLGRLLRPYQEDPQGFSAAGFKKQGMLLEGKTRLTVGGRPAQLFQATRRALGTRFRTWILVADRGGWTLLITALFPEAHTAELSPLLKRAVLSVQPAGAPPAAAARLAPSATRPAPRFTAEKPAAPSETVPRGLTRLPFTLQPFPGLELALEDPLMTIYTVGGVIPVPNPGSPMVVAGRSIGTGALGDTSALAKRQLMQVSAYSDVKFQSHQGVKLAGLNGFETVASAHSARTGQRLLLYQAIVFDADGYFRIMGSVAAEGGKTYLPRFRTMARSLKFRP